MQCQRHHSWFVNPGRHASYDSHAGLSGFASRLELIHLLLQRTLTSKEKLLPTVPDETCGCHRPQASSVSNAKVQICTYRAPNYWSRPALTCSCTGIRNR